MTFSLIEVIALFFISINIFIIFSCLIALINRHFALRARIKIQANNELNYILTIIIIEYLKYAEIKGDDFIALDIKKDLPKNIKEKLNAFGFKCNINLLGQIKVERIK